MSNPTNCQTLACGALDSPLTDGRGTFCRGGDGISGGVSWIGRRVFMHSRVIRTRFSHRNLVWSVNRRLEHAGGNSKLRVIFGPWSFNVCPRRVLVGSLSRSYSMNQLLGWKFPGDACLMRNGNARSSTATQNEHPVPTHSRVTRKSSGDTRGYLGSERTHSTPLHTH